MRQQTPHLFDRHNDFGIAAFLEGFRPLNKLREQRGPVVFELGAIDEAADDLAFVELLVEGELIYVARVRFEVESPCRIKYWGSYPPLPKGIVLRDYQPEDAAGCVAPSGTFAISRKGTLCFLSSTPRRNRNPCRRRPLCSYRSDGFWQPQWLSSPRCPVPRRLPGK